VNEETFHEPRRKAYEMKKMRLVKWAVWIPAWHDYARNFLKRMVIYDTRADALRDARRHPLKAVVRKMFLEEVRP
jgi:hypothetical protein